MRIIWQTVYSVVAAATLIGTLLVAVSAATHSTPLALAGLILFVMGLAAFRVALDVRWLTAARDRIDRDREQLTRDRSQFDADRAVFASDAARTRRDLEDLERRNRERLADDRATMLAEVEVERDRMRTALAGTKAAIERAAFALGWEMRGRGVAADDQTRAKIITLPVAAQLDATIGTGTHRN